MIEEIKIDIENKKEKTIGLDDDCDKNNIITIKVIQSGKSIGDIDEYKYILFHVHKEILIQSGYFASLLSCVVDNNIIEFSTDIISFDEMKILLKFLFKSYYLETTDYNMRLIRIDKLTDLFKGWESDFIDKVYEMGYLNEILRISNYFDVKNFLYLACAKYALVTRTINIRLLNNTNKNEYMPKKT